MDEMANPSGPRKELINNHCSEFMQLIKVRTYFTSLHLDILETFVRNRIENHVMCNTKPLNFLLVTPWL